MTVLACTYVRAKWFKQSNTTLEQESPISISCTMQLEIKGNIGLKYERGDHPQCTHTLAIVCPFHDCVIEHMTQ